MLAGRKEILGRICMYHETWDFIIIDSILIPQWQLLVSSFKTSWFSRLSYFWS